MRKTWNAAWLAMACAMALPALAQEPAPPQVPPPLTPEETLAQPLDPAPEAKPKAANGNGSTSGSANGSANGSTKSSSSGSYLADPREVRRERRKAWIFNRYAGSIEMQDKTPYPYGYYGDYYFRGWKPDWVYPLPPPPLRFEEPPVIRHPEGMPNMESPTDQPPVPAAAKARGRTKRG